MLDIHAVTHSRAGTLLFTHDAALAVNSHQVGNGRILQLTLVLAVILRISLIIIVIFIFVFGVFTVVIRLVIVSLDQSLSLTLASAQIAMLFLLTVSEHDHVVFEFTILLNCLQELHHDKKCVSYLKQQV